jgi:C4-dicarboxylate-specific signal transduction histidine kinase
MKFDWQGRPRSNSLVVVGPLAIAMTVILALDTFTDYAIAAAVFYTAIILIATRLLPQRSVVVLACISVLLTVVSFAFTQSGAYEVGLVNTAISIVAIAVTTYLSQKLVAAEAAAYEARERLLRIARVTSLGELTASIAHEVNQPLTAVVTSAGACKRWLAQDPPSIENAERGVERIVKEASRASEIMSRVRGLTSGKAPQKLRFDLNDAIREIIALARGQLDRNDISARLYLRQGLPMVVADRVQIQQVVGNLLLNAIEATIASPREPRELEITSEAEGSKTVLFSIADTGVGFRSTDAEHLFDAFWTTKADGVGLGLTISRSIVESNGGRIWAQANEEGGAVFRFSVPSDKATRV